MFGKGAGVERGVLQILGVAADCDHLVNPPSDPNAHAMLLPVPSRLLPEIEGKTHGLGDGVHLRGR